MMRPVLANSLLVLALLWSVPAGHATEIAQVCVQQTTQQTTTSATFVDVTGASISSGSLTAGHPYWIYYTAHATETSTGVLGVQVVHGSTAFTDSIESLSAIGASDRIPTGFQYLWSAVSSEGIKLQFKVSAGTGGLDQITLCAIDMNSLVANQDYWFAERTTDDSLSTTPTDGASVTLTPSVAGEEYAVFSYSLYTLSNTADSWITRIERSGEASSSTPEARLAFSSTSPIQGAMLMRPFTLGAASNTVKEVSASTATQHTRTYSNIMVLRLNAFRNRATAYTDADTSTLSTTGFATNLQTVTHTPSITGNSLIFAYWGYDSNSNSRLANTRVRVDSTDSPATQTSDAYVFRAANDATGELAIPHLTIENLSSGAHTIDLDGSVDNAAASSTGQHRAIIAFTTELNTSSRGPITPREDW